MTHAHVDPAGDGAPLAPVPIGKGLPSSLWAVPCSELSNQAHLPPSPWHVAHTSMVHAGKLEVCDWGGYTEGPLRTRRSSGAGALVLLKGACSSRATGELPKPGGKGHGRGWPRLQ